MARAFGIHGGLQDSTLPELRRLWRFVDQAGFDWLSVWDHLDVSFFGSNSCFEALSALTLIAAETTRVRIGCLVFCINYRHPGVLAKALTTIDHASNGRLEVGLGAGWHEGEYDAYGIHFPPIATRQDQLEEGIQIIRSLFTQERTTFNGKHFQLREAVCSPKPLQARVPLWIGGSGEKRTLRTAARHADGWDTAFVSPEVFRQKNQVLDQWCEKQQRDPASIVRMASLGFHLTADPAQAKQERERFRAYWGPMAEGIEEGMLFGTPRDAVDRIGQYFEAGAARVVLDLLQSPLDWEALQGFVEGVMPAFR
jgi:F420-dependent oxidoreductase-like protein